MFGGNICVHPIILSGATANLLSLPKLADQGCSFSGDRESLQVYEPDGSLLIEAFRNSKGFWAFEIVPAVEINFRIASTERHFTREQIIRAKEARHLHSRLGHPSDSSLCMMLDNGGLIGTHLTSVDVRNGRAILGPCEACIIGKRRNPSLYNSLSAPATHPG